MFKKKNKESPVKAKEIKRSDSNDDLAKFFKTKIRVETDTRVYVTNFYGMPLQETVEENKCCNIM